ncbi:MAG: DNA/RNA nuclease SfsA [Candidatus Thorarchaeota archaeon]
MRHSDQVFEARFLSRPNRFLAKLELNGAEIEAFVPNPGRMHELMIPGKSMYVRLNPGDHRRTDYDLIGLHHDGVLISLDSNLPNRFMREMLVNHSLPFFSGYDDVQSEPRMYGGRFDFRLSGANGVQLIEVKSCTLVEDGRASFPDAPTERGARHLRGLMRALSEGVASRAAVVFVIQRPDATVFSPNDATDPAFGTTLREAYRAGVDVIPLITMVNDWHLDYIRRIALDLTVRR